MDLEGTIVFGYFVIGVGPLLVCMHSIKMSLKIIIGSFVVGVGALVVCMHSIKMSPKIINLYHIIGEVARTND